MNNANKFVCEINLDYYEPTITCTSVTNICWFLLLIYIYYAAQHVKLTVFLTYLFWAMKKYVIIRRIGFQQIHWCVCHNIMQHFAMVVSRWIFWDEFLFKVDWSATRFFETLPSTVYPIVDKYRRVNCCIQPETYSMQQNIVFHCF